MEAALPSVLAGLVGVPLIAVPTSVGYGWHMEGLTAWLAVLNSCAAGVLSVNVDNGFGAGVAAAPIAPPAAPPEPGACSGATPGTGGPGECCWPRCLARGHPSGGGAAGAPGSP